MELPMGLPMESPTAHECFHVDCAGLRHDKIQVGYGAYNLIFIFLFFYLKFFFIKQFFRNGKRDL